MKWRVLVLVVAAAALRLGFGAGVRDQSLREAAQSSGVLIGTAVRPAQLSEAAYASTLAREFNMLEPEDVLKWEEVHPEPQSFDFAHADQIVDFAIRHGMKVRNHHDWRKHNRPGHIHRELTVKEKTVGKEGSVQPCGNTTIQTRTEAKSSPVVSRWAGQCPAGRLIR
jgi:GH35 family endo-1,4-beta-xylanase